MNKAHKCKVCGKSFNWQSSLNRHVLNVHKGPHRTQNKRFKCNMCGLEAYQQCNLSSHMKTHTGERPFKCKFDSCGMEFKEKAHLQRHTKHKHSSDRALKCEFPGCLHTAKTSENLIVHMKFVHSGDRPFACSHSRCNFRTKRREDLSRHTARVHNGLKATACSKCNYRTNNTSNLARHMIIHNGTDGKFLDSNTRRQKTLLPCPVSGCGRHVTTQEALKYHVKLHDPSGRPFQCPLCWKLFPTLFQLQNHCVVHTNEKPFECGLCEYAASFRSVVKTHISRAHANVEFPFIVHLLDDRECLHCKVTMTAAEFVVHSTSQ